MHDVSTVNASLEKNLVRQTDSHAEESTVDTALTKDVKHKSDFNAVSTVDTAYNEKNNEESTVNTSLKKKVFIPHDVSTINTSSGKNMVHETDFHAVSTVEIASINQANDKSEINTPSLIKKNVTVNDVSTVDTSLGKNIIHQTDFHAVSTVDTAHYKKTNEETKVDTALNRKAVSMHDVSTVGFSSNAVSSVDTAYARDTNEESNVDTASKSKDLSAHDVFLSTIHHHNVKLSSLEEKKALEEAAKNEEINKHLNVKPSSLEEKKALEEAEKMKK